MRLTIEALGRTLTISYERDTDSSDETEHDHVGGSFEIAPEPDGEYVYEERAHGFGLRGAERR